MKKSNFTDQQIAFALRHAEEETPVVGACRKMGISDARSGDAAARLPPETGGE